MLPASGVVLDAGTAMFRVRDCLATTTVDIFLSHSHLDHVVGLSFLLDVLHGKSMDRVSVHGDENKLEAIRQHLFSPALFPIMPQITWEPLKSPVRLNDGGVVSYFPVAHPGGAMAFRIDWKDRSMAYVTDTTAEPGAAYTERIRGVDVLVHECYFPDGQEDLARLTGHSCTTPVAQVAASAAVGRLILVHANPLDDREDPVGLTTARRIFPAAELGTDGQIVEF
jgi:ribonuclease BN (tRNA processing enzyme)